MLYEPIEIKTMNYLKPVAVIYNPNSGKSRNVRDQIQTAMNRAQIPFEFLETTHRNHAMELS